MLPSRTLEPLPTRHPPGPSRPAPVASPRFEWAIAFFQTWLVSGLYLDGWAHNHIAALETFFSPWHALLYSGLFAMTGFVFGIVQRNHAAGRPWRRSLPAGYGTLPAGAVIFLVGGLLDMTWHILFGIESSINGLISPPHLLIAAGATLIGMAPVRAAWLRPDARLASWRRQGPMLLALAYTLSLEMFLTQYVHPFSTPYLSLRHETTNPYYGQAIGTASVFLQTALLMSFVALLIRRWAWRLPTGVMTLILTVTAALMSTQRDEYLVVPIGLVAGVGADLLGGWLRPAVQRPRRLRAFAFLVPVLLYTLTWIVFAAVEGTWWSAHLLVGTAIMAGVVGWSTSFVALPPALPGPRLTGVAEPSRLG